eukprot:765804-Hanusia_phi.AAC.1
MVRPSASDHNKSIGLLFAKTVLAESGPSSYVCRSGCWSIYSVLKTCCPSVMRSDDPYTGRNGMTEMEFSKVLEKSGMKKVRARKTMFKRNDDTWSSYGEPGGREGREGRE